MANELLPCPFCSGPAEIYNPFHMIGKPSQPATYRGGVRCRACGCESKATTPPDGAITTWNRRANAAPQASTVAGEARQLPTINVGGKERPQQWFTAKEVRQLLDAAPQASAEQMQAALQKSFDMGKFYGSLPETDAEDVRNAALEEAYEAVACLYAAYYQHSKRSESDDILQALKQAGDDIRALKQPQADKDGCTCPSGDGSLRHPCPMHPGADKDGGQQRAGDGKTREAGDYTRGGALNFDDPAPAGPEGIRSQFNACMHRNECRAMLDRQPKLRADASAVRRALIAASNYIDTLGGDSKSYRAALYAPQAEQGERDAG